MGPSTLRTELSEALIGRCVTSDDPDDPFTIEAGHDIYYCLEAG